MRVAVLGAGPAGLYFSLLAKKANPAHQITVFERNPPDATYGWGVVFSEETLGALRDADRPTFDRIIESFATWNAIDIRYRGETVRSRGHAFSGLARKQLLAILQERCRELGVELRFFQEMAELPEGDLVIGADGVNSLARRLHDGAFRPSLHVHGTKFVWFGTDLVFNAFTFIFRENEHGLFQVHAYPFDAATSTFIVECPEATWRAAGLDQATEEDSIAYCEKLFAEDLAGHSLMSNRSLWVSFVTLSNQTWHDRNLVLLGDAAHTAHFTIGSGTKLAMEDAIALVEALERRPSTLEAALVDYEMERQPVVERFQQAALESAAYFENVRRYASFEPLQFAFNLLTRSGRITHLELRRRDPRFVTSVDAAFAARAEGRTNASEVLIAPPPMLAPLELRGERVRNRVVMAPVGEDAAVDGTPNERHEDQLLEAARSGAGLVLTEMVAVSPDGRITPGTPGVYAGEHAEAWRQILDRIHAESEALVIIQLSHAGPRGSTRPRQDGVDRPLREGGWPVLSPSMGVADLGLVAEAFARSAAMALDAGFDLVLLNFAHGYLLSSFISPLTNTRVDRYGGSLEHRMRFPLEVFDAVRSAWPEEKPLGVGLNATDWVRGGTEPDQAVAAARMLRDRGCDFVRVLAGQTTRRARPEYGRLFLVPFSDRIRNEADVPTMVGGNITAYDEADTVLAAGRADLCQIDPVS
ncbi:MAG TPA: FAD-dependent monooxygenase [Actinomycetota bacterium]